MVNALGMVDKAFLGSKTDMFEPLKEIRPDIITLGYDQNFDIDYLEKELTNRGLPAKVVRIRFSKECAFCSTGAIIKEVLKRYG
jgi:FAD synthetase